MPLPNAHSFFWAFEKRGWDYIFKCMHAQNPFHCRSIIPLSLCAFLSNKKNKCMHKPFLHFNPRIKHIKRLMACQTKRSQIGLIWSQLLFGSELCKTISTINKPLEPLYVHSIRLWKQCQEFSNRPWPAFYNIIIVGESALEALGTSLE